ncbi:hypothetical protein GLAREA_12130 [Glarea lozoyensis ATCC 20868]|uniref:Heterokaryon incompatibility domain-containing protein n=1 Tax=Glarea lozoyensis (strain ATCC 20868 / MF5171) TaxID=1116229 RepID=S3E0I2_GLAL2|nr:uncharacterized protein GLAREA_12130 [Glarea lozoyensis ATCC 20868]EPE32048.1 hypothetical protein GLAREA_12130 [Glarea lozoyensis ATCC 20868]
MASYKYECLKSDDAIRLLILQPSEDLESEIHCSLITTTLTECEDDIIDGYTALSYVWGSSLDSKQIYVGGIPIHVTQNLFDALRDLRDTYRTQRLWIDAICINQAHEAERNQQVSIMGTIYSKAKHTVIYLGPDEQNPSCFDFIKQYLLDRKSTYIAGFLEFITLEALSSAWFTRVWVLQELVMSRDPLLQLGRSRMRWDTFNQYLKLRPLWAQPSVHELSSQEIGVVHNTLDNLRTPLRGVNDLYRPFRDMHLVRSKFQGWKLNIDLPAGLNLGEILQSRRGFGVLDPRDMIYAHLGMVPNKYGQKVDYGQSVSQVFTRIAIGLFCESSDLSWLGKIGRACLGDKIEGLPSWVPNWTLPVVEAPQYHHEPGSIRYGKFVNFKGAVMLFLVNRQSRRPLASRIHCDKLPSLLALECDFLGCVAELLPIANQEPTDDPYQAEGIWNDNSNFLQAFLNDMQYIKLVVPASTLPGDYICTTTTSDKIGVVLRPIWPTIEASLAQGILSWYARHSDAWQSDAWQGTNPCELSEGQDPLGHVLHTRLVGECFYNRRHLGRRKEETRIAILY